MKSLILGFLLFFASINAFADKVGTDKYGDIVVNGEKLYVTLKYDGKRMDLHGETFFEISGKNPGLYISLFPDVATKGASMTEHIVIVDSTNDKTRQSNVLDTGLDFQWGDNNYVIFEGNAMYFGIYSPKRMQFVYRDGVLEENKGPWRGPAKPQTYIEPTGKDPCFNVNGVEDCRREVAREKARQARLKQKAAPAAK